jgi:hypothetical protein
MAATLYEWDAKSLLKGRSEYAPSINRQLTFSPVFQTARLKAVPRRIPNAVHISAAC